MRPDERDAAHLWDMLDAARAVGEFVGDRRREEFLAPGREAEMRRLAVERKLEILGEAARRVSEELRRGHPEIPWTDIVGLRNVISHQYDSPLFCGLGEKRREFLQISQERDSPCSRTREDSPL
ncbi:MAG: DUF86 domain-containing protein, partial [Candidatus Hydrogenedentota bacterium]